MPCCVHDPTSFVLSFFRFVISTLSKFLWSSTPGIVAAERMIIPPQTPLSRAVEEMLKAPFDVRIILEHETLEAIDLRVYFSIPFGIDEERAGSWTSSENQTPGKGGSLEPYA